MKATRTRHGWVHIFTTDRPSLTLQIRNFDLFRTCRTALLRGNWQEFNWHDASRGPSAIAELLVACNIARYSPILIFFCRNSGRNRWFTYLTKVGARWAWRQWVRYFRNLSNIDDRVRNISWQTLNLTQTLTLILILTLTLTIYIHIHIHGYLC